MDAEPSERGAGALPSGEFVTIRTGSWRELGAAARAVRARVFIAEQGIPEADEHDGCDADALHVVALAPDGSPVGTGRILPVHAPCWQIGRMAVLARWRDRGIGRRLLRALETSALERGARCVALHAQASAARFYEHLGYRTCGAPFVEVGIAHVTMRRPLGEPGGAAHESRRMPRARE